MAMKEKDQAVTLNLHVVNTMVSFMADMEYLKKLADLQKKLGINRSEAIRVAIDDAVDKYVEPADRQFSVVDKDWMGTIQKMKDISATCEAYMKERYSEEFDMEGIKKSSRFRELLLFPGLEEHLQTRGGKISLWDLIDFTRSRADLDKTHESEVTDK
jgi:hypothetical protein